MKKLLIKLDRSILNGTLIKIFESLRSRYFLSVVRSKNSHSLEIFYSNNDKCELAQLCDIYGSDKGEITSENNPYQWPSHTYTDFYHLLFSHCRNKITKVLECGIGTNNPNIDSSMGAKGKPGASLRVWRDYFANAKIIGIDIDKEILFSDERIATYCVDQTSSASLKKFWDDIGMSDFDFIVDDGLHEYRAGISLFKNSIEHLASNGIYIIEDVSPYALANYLSFFREVEGLYHCRYVSLYRPSLPLIDNSILMVTKKL